MESLVVLVVCQIELVKRVSLTWITIRKSIIDCDVQIQVEATEDIIEERFGGFDFKHLNSRRIAFVELKHLFSSL